MNATDLSKEFGISVAEFSAFLSSHGLRCPDTAALKPDVVARCRALWERERRSRTDRAHYPRQGVAEDGIGRRPGAGSAERRLTHGAVIDVANVAHGFAGIARHASLGRVLQVRDALRAMNCEPVMVADAALKHRIDDSAGYGTLLSAGEILEAPAGTAADVAILHHSRRTGAWVVSNDRFTEHLASREFLGWTPRSIRFAFDRDGPTLHFEE